MDTDIVGLTDYKKAVYQASKRKLEGDDEDGVQSSPTKRACLEILKTDAIILPLIIFNDFHQLNPLGGVSWNHYQRGSEPLGNRTIRQL